MDKEITKKYLDSLTQNIIGALIEVHKRLGPGLLEKVYQKCLMKEFEIRNINYVVEKLFFIDYKGFKVDTDLRCDFLIENCIVLELKSVKEMESIFEAQILTYMKLLEVPKGILVNFNVKNIYYEGQKTYVNEYFRELPYE